MKKTLSMALAAVLCVSGGFAADGNKLVNVEQSEEANYRLGTEVLAQIRSDYSAGKYNEFLRAMDIIYGESIEKEHVLGLGKMRQGARDNDQWLKGVREIQAKTNKQLLQAVSGIDSNFATKVRNVAVLESEESPFLKVHQMQPGTGTQDENLLIALDLEYEFKAIHLDTPRHHSQDPKSTRDLHYALKMEQMDKILLAAQSFEDASLKAAVNHFANDLDARLARHYDLLDLRALAKDMKQARNQTEQSVAMILQAHQDNIQELTRNYLGSVTLFL